MPEYRMYKIRRDGHVVGEPIDLMAADDRAAIEAAQQQLDGYDIEMWQGPRVVAYLVPEKVAS